MSGVAVMHSFGHKGVKCTVSKGENGTYHFEFAIGGAMISAKAQTKLIGMAIRRARTRIERELRKRAK